MLGVAIMLMWQLRLESQTGSFGLFVDEVSVPSQRIYQCPREHMCNRKLVSE